MSATETGMPSQGTFEGIEVIHHENRLKACPVGGLGTTSKLPIGTKVRITVDAAVVGVRHERIKDLPDLERVHIFEALEGGAAVIEEL